MKGLYKIRGLIRTKTHGKCTVCGQDTYIFDIDFNCYVHPICQFKLMDDYVYADMKE